MEPSGDSAELTSLNWCVNRFPVPQDDSFQSQPRQSALWAVQSRNASAGWLSAIRRPLPGPLVSGSGAIMRCQKRFVKCFVVSFLRHYIFFTQASEWPNFLNRACLLSIVARGLAGLVWNSAEASRSDCNWRFHQHHQVKSTRRVVRLRGYRFPGYLSRLAG